MSLTFIRMGQRTMKLTAWRTLRATPYQRPFVCQSCLRSPPHQLKSASYDRPRRRLQTNASTSLHQNETKPHRNGKQDKAKTKNAKTAGLDHSGQSHRRNAQKDHTLEEWELTVGIEIHAELNTTRKLFSTAKTSLSDTPNSHASLFDTAYPGSQPQFQQETLLPALRAALALNCQVQEKSSWDRKHYFWWDQPNGYQITQYYEPLARNGKLVIYEHDGIDPVDFPSVTINIKQIQMEQDTAKTVLQPPNTYLIDFNRASHPLIEIITSPEIHSPKTAAAFVKKVQSILKAVGANTTGMEMGGLRADVNVSVRRRHGDDSTRHIFEYNGVSGLGQRTEIKNLSSFKAVEDAIIAERDRQIAVLEAGGEIRGETRGWTLGSSETKLLRAKEGEVDYRYMPDPDLDEIIIGEDLLQHLRDTLPRLPDEIIVMLSEDPDHGLTSKDAKTLATLDEGDRLEYYLETLALVRANSQRDTTEWIKASRTVANWVLNDLPTHLAATEQAFPYTPTSSLTQPTSHSTSPIDPIILASILTHLLEGSITLPSARRLLSLIPNPSPTSETLISDLIRANNLQLIALSQHAYLTLARAIIAENEPLASTVRTALHADSTSDQKKTRGKLMWFVGQMVRRGADGRIEPALAEESVRTALLEN